MEVLSKGQEQWRGHGGEGNELASCWTPGGVADLLLSLTGEEFYEASPYELVTSRLSDIFRLASIFSGKWLLVLCFHEGLPYPLKQAWIFRPWALPVGKDAPDTTTKAVC